jgi:putative ATP-binding cassette transporter
MDSESPRATDLTVSLPHRARCCWPAKNLRVSSGRPGVAAGPLRQRQIDAVPGVLPASGRLRRGRVSGAPPIRCFIPQRPYFPNGPLRDALAYPEAASRYSDAALRQALVDALLPDLATRLDDADAWSQKLSGGEQQRLAIARVLLKQPQWGVCRRSHQRTRPTGRADPLPATRRAGQAHRRWPGLDCPIAPRLPAFTGRRGP